MNTSIDYTITHIEVVALRDLLQQFREILADNDPQDAALARLSPSVYPDDEAASREFRRLTASDASARRLADAETVEESLAEVAVSEDPELEVTLALTQGDVLAWMRSLSAIRLVIATRLGIDAQGTPANDDEATNSIYDWLGYRLETLIEASN